MEPESGVVYTVTMWRRLVILGCAAMLGVAGCGGSGESDLTEGRTPDEILVGAQGAAAAETMFQFAVDGSTKGTLTPGDRTPSVVIRALAGGITAEGQGTVNDDDATVDFDASMTGLPSLQGNVTKVDGKLFVGVLGTDYRVDLPEEQVRMARPALIPSGLLTWITSPTVEGRETIDGVETVRMTGEVDLDVVARDTLNALARVDSSEIGEDDVRRSIPQVRRALTERSVQMWIGTSDLLPRRIVVRLAFLGKVTAFPELRRGELRFDARFSNYGESVTISEPQTDRVLNLDSASSLLG